MSILPFVHASGSPGQIGRDVGTMLAPAVARHVAAWVEHIGHETGASPAAIRETARLFAGPIRTHAPFLWEELEGLAQGARVPIDDLLLLQARAEVLRAHRTARPTPPALECTTFAVGGRRTSNGGVFFGQNVDLVPFVESFGVIIRQHPTDAPATLLYTTAGLLGHNGLNEAGVGVCANFIDDPSGWGDGLPRYLLSRLALRRETADDAVKAMLDVPRAASRNVLVADARGTFLDAELLRTESAVLTGADDLLVHANHLEAPAFQGCETPSVNSLCRRARLPQLFEDRGADAADAPGPLGAADFRRFYLDHENTLLSLCPHPFVSLNIQTVVSVIGDLGARTLDVARGTPCRNCYATYSLATCREGALSVTMAE